MKRYLIRALRKLKLLKRITIYPLISISGVKFKIPIINETGIYNYLNLSEPWMQHILNKLINNEKAFIDIGINLGQTLIKVKAVNKSISYIGFEPNPLCVNYTNELIKANAFSNTEIYPVGISENSAVLKLNLFSESEYDSAASIIEDFRDPKSIKKSINVPVFNLSDLTLKKDKEIGIVKIDVDGAELEVMKGLKKIMVSDRPFILIEILPVYSTENIVRINRQNEIQNILTQNKYSIFRVIKNYEKYEEISKIDAFNIHSDLNKCEYIFSPNEKIEELIEILANNV